MTEQQPLTREDVQRLFAEKRYDEIEQARAGGRIPGFGQPPLPTDRQLTSAEVHLLFAAGDFAAVEAARARGQLTSILTNPTEGTK